MSVNNKLIRSTLLSLFDKGFKTVKAHEEITKLYSQNSVSIATVNNWFNKFRLGNRNLDDKIVVKPKKKVTDEYLIDLISKNPDFTMAELAKLAGISVSSISIRIKEINSNGESVYYRKKRIKKFADEHLTDLINKNPGLNIEELARLTNVSKSTIDRRIKFINGNGESTYFSKKGLPKFTDEYLIDLINKHTDLSVTGLAKLAGASSSTISRRIKEIISKGKMVNYISKYNLNDQSEEFSLPNPKLTNKYLVDLINNNPDLSIDKLAMHADTSPSTISKRIEQINRYGQRAMYQKKNLQKFTDEFLIDLVNNNPNLNMKELAKLAGTSRITIFNRLNQINSNGEIVNYRSKIMPKFTDEYLIDLVDNNSDLNIKELAKLAGTSQATISNRLKQINEGGESAKYYKKTNHKITDEYLIDLINKYPNFNMKELAELAGISSKTISRRIKQLDDRSYKEIMQVKRN